MKTTDNQHHQKEASGGRVEQGRFTLCWVPIPVKLTSTLAQDFGVRFDKTCSEAHHPDINGTYYLAFDCERVEVQHFHTWK